MSAIAFADTELDRSLTFYAECSEGQTLRFSPLPTCWRICFTPAIISACGRYPISGIDIRFGRKQDVETAIAALVREGFTTGRKLREQPQERNRIIAESLAW